MLNPLGTIIKCITGNLDGTDAERYDKQIEQLQENQSKLKVNTLDQISLLETTINKFQHLISNITHNQIVLKSRIMQIEANIKRVALEQAKTHEYFQIHIVLNQITLIYQTIYNVFEKIEVAITFAKINTLHNSIISPIELLSEIKNIKSHLKTDMLPLEDSVANMLSFERIIEIKSFSKNSVITFILELPLVETEIYQYFRLYPIPIPKTNNLFQITIPHKPYVAYSGMRYSYMDQQCTQMLPKEYICKNAHTAYLEDDPPCAVQLLSYKKNITNCQIFNIKLSQLQVTKISDGKWFITTPARQIAVTTCGTAKNNIPLFGSYLLESNPNCEVRLQSFILQTHKPSQLAYVKLNLPALNFTMVNRNSSAIFNPPALNLDIVNFKETRDIQEKLEQQRQHIENVSVPVYVKRASVWTIVLYVLFSIAAVYLLKNLIFKHCQKPKTNDEIVI